MGYALVAHVDGAPTTGGVDTSAADLIVLVTVGATNTPSDNNSNTWTPLTITSDSNGFTQTRLWYCQGLTIGRSGHTFDFSVYTPGYIAAAAFSGSIASPFDVENGAAILSATSRNSGNITPGQNNELVISGLGSGGTASAQTIDSGFTITDSRTAINGVSYGGGLAYLIQTTATTVNPTWSWTAANSGVNRVASFMTTAVVALDEDGEWIIPTQSW